MSGDHRQVPPISGTSLFNPHHHGATVRQRRIGTMTGLQLDIRTILLEVATGAVPRRHTRIGHHIAAEVIRSHTETEILAVADLAAVIVTIHRDLHPCVPNHVKGNPHLRKVKLRTALQEFLDLNW